MADIAETRPPLAGMPPRSDYVLRHGGRYDRDLVHFVEQWASAGVMVFKQAEAEALWECALEGDKITERERDTLKCVVRKPTHIIIRCVVPEGSQRQTPGRMVDGGFQKRKGGAGEPRALVAAPRARPRVRKIEPSLCVR